MTIPTLILATLLAANPSKAFLSLFEEGEYHPTYGKLQGERIQYRLFAPRDESSRKRYPMMVWLHNYGGGDSGNIRNVRWLEHVIKDLAHVEQYRFFILAVECPKKHRRWYINRRKPVASDSEPDDMLTINHQIIQKLIEDRPIDENRIFLTGWWVGGDACYEMAARHPNFFSAVMPTSSSPRNLSIADKLVDTPIWAFHNLYQPESPPDREQKMIDAINAAGGNALLTTPPRKKYSCFVPAYGEYKMLDWLLAQKRGAWVCWTPPGYRTWSWWHILVIPCGYAGIVWLGFFCRRRRLEKLEE